MAALCGQQAADVPQPLHVRQAHGLVPLDLADGQDRRPVVVESEGSHVDLVGCLFSRVVHGARVDAGRESSSDLLGGEVPRPVAAELLEMRPEDVGGEAALAARP